MKLHILLNAFTLSKPFNVVNNKARIDFLDTTIEFTENLPDGTYEPVKVITKLGDKYHYKLLDVYVDREPVLLYETMLPEGLYPSFPHEDPEDVESFIANVEPYLNKEQIKILANILGWYGVFTCTEFPVEFKHMHHLAIERFDIKHQYSHEQYSAITGTYDGHKYVLPLDCALISVTR